MEKDSFVSIALEENLIQAAIWNIKDDSANIISVSPSVNYEDDETLINACDECLSGCVQDLPQNLEEPSKAVFGVPAFWIKDGQIQRNYLDKIRLLCNKLSLNPTGFVSLPEAIAHYEKSINSTPLSGILIGIYQSSIDVSLFRLGNLTGTVNVARSLNLVEDIVEGIARFDLKEMIPSKFILYDGHTNDLEEIKQELIKADWNNLDEKIKFLHVPSTEIVDSDTKMASVCLGAAAEIANLSKIIFKSTKVQKTKDVLSNQKSEPEDVQNFVDPKSLGFSSMENQKIKLKKIKIPSLNMSFLKKDLIRENIVFFASVGLLISFLVIFLAYWFLPKADVSLIISPVKIDENKGISFDPKASNINASNLVVPAKVVSATVSGDKTKQTSGTKTIGTSAKGSVTFYNVGGETTIAKGTILSSSSLKYSLNDDVTVASASGAASSSIAKGNITAVGVGADYNLAGGSIFSVGNFSSSLIQAKNDDPLSGGTSQEVAAVSKDDISSLTKSLIDELTKKGKDQLKENLSGELLVESKVTTQTIDINSNHNEGEEASTVKMTINAKVEGLVVKRQDMDDLAKQIFKDKVKSGFSMKDDQIDFIFGDKDVEFKINLLPSIDTLKLANQIAGKNLKDAKTILSKVSGFSDVVFSLKPNINFLQTLPHIAKNISVTLEAK